MESEQPAAPAQPQKATQPHNRVVYAGDYPSNPFKTAMTGLKVFWENGKSLIAGVVGLEFLLLLATWLFVVITVVAGILLLAASFSNGAFSEDITKQLPESLTTTTSGLAGAGAATGIILIICFVLMLLAGIFAHALQLSFVGKTVALRQKATFGDVVKTAWRRMWPLLAQMLLLILAVGASIFLVTATLGLLFNFNSLGGFVVLLGLLYLLVTIFGIFLFARLAFAGLGVVVNNLGPWQAIKHSFALTKGHVGEVLGVGAIAVAGFSVVGLISSLINYGVVKADLPALVVVAGLVLMVLYMVLGMGFMAIITERYAQLLSLEQSKIAHKTEWGSVVAAIALAVVVVIVSTTAQSQLSPISETDFNIPDSSTPDIYLDDQLQQQDLYDQNFEDMSEEDLQKWLDSFKQDSNSIDPQLQ